MEEANIIRTLILDTNGPDLFSASSARNSEYEVKISELPVCGAQGLWLFQFAAKFVEQIEAVEKCGGTISCGQ